VDGNAQSGQADFTLLQDWDDHFAIQGVQGKHADGWLAAGDGRRHVTLSVRDFWQQYPKSLALAGNVVSVGLCPPIQTDPYQDKEDAIYFYLKDGGYKLKSGLAKTHDLVIGLRAGRPGRAARPADRHVLLARVVGNRNARLVIATARPSGGLLCHVRDWRPGTNFSKRV